MITPLISDCRCDECVDRLWNIDENCIPCSAHCDNLGTEPKSLCDKNTGQCVCKTNVQGMSSQTICDIFQREGMKVIVYVELVFYATAQSIFLEQLSERIA